MEERKRKKHTWELGSMLARLLTSGCLLDAGTFAAVLACLSECLLARLLISCALAGIPTGTLARLLASDLVPVAVLLVRCLARLAG